MFKSWHCGRRNSWSGSPGSPRSQHDPAGVRCPHIPGWVPGKNRAREIPLLHTRKNLPSSRLIKTPLDPYFYPTCVSEPQSRSTKGCLEFRAGSPWIQLGNFTGIMAATATWKTLWKSPHSQKSAQASAPEADSPFLSLQPLLNPESPLCPISEIIRN